MPTEVILKPELLDPYFGVIVAFHSLRKFHAARFTARVFLDFDFQKTFELGFAIKLQPAAEAGIGCDHKTPERETLREPGNVIGFESERTITADVQCPFDRRRWRGLGESRCGC